MMLHLLDHTGKEPNGKKFWIDWSKSWRVIEQTKIIEGGEAQTSIDQLRVSLKTTECLNFCGHDPVYGIIAKDKKGKTIRRNERIIICQKPKNQPATSELTKEQWNALPTEKRPPNHHQLALKKI